MQSFKSFQQRLFQVNDASFNEFALKLFHFQAENNSVYAAYINSLGIDAVSVKTIPKIPFMPISFFKRHMVKTSSWNEEVIYTSSGTTKTNVSQHFVKDNSQYLKNTETIFNRFYGNLEDYHTFFLLPNYLEQGGSSLVAMADHFIRKSNSPYSGFYIDDIKGLLSAIKSANEENDSRGIILCGVSFALLDLAEIFNPDLSGVIVMETGGMKGRRKEIIRSDLHSQLCNSFNIDRIHSEYGMTELSSQAYSKGGGKFDAPPWMRILLRDINDPLDVGRVKSGGINVIDLANITSCAFIETHDLGVLDKEGKLEILGRFDNSDIRGCNLMV